MTTNSTFSITLSDDDWGKIDTIAAFHNTTRPALLQKWIREGIEREMGDPEGIERQIEATKQRLMEAAETVRQRRERGDTS